MFHYFELLLMLRKVYFLILLGLFDKSVMSAVASLIWCPPSDQVVMGSIPTVGAFLRYPPIDTKYWF
ncbi:hypothetical protein DPMN_190430 [Dreissena polymorpha]|uniref:Uncharacterized protein n=1 Tax=Dreissena polymorpha TaxID=45954 RepID=A0A9D4DVX5_DREPO|nr:hypothetical protein DPMN_190430 [Dreissena polymorpha]